MPTSLKNRQIQHFESIQGCWKQKVLLEILNLRVEYELKKILGNKRNLCLHGDSVSEFIEYKNGDSILYIISSNSPQRHFIFNINSFHVLNFALST